jgi:hypothetical protein
MPDWSFVGLDREQRGLRSVWIAAVESNVVPGARRLAEADHPATALLALADLLAGGRAP